MDRGPVLVLNRNYQPIHVTDVKRAFCLLYQGSARAVDESLNVLDFEAWCAAEIPEGAPTIGTVSQPIRIPYVILLHECTHYRISRVRFSRMNVYLRDGNTCQYCGTKLPRAKLNLDHVVPRTQGGPTSWENVVASCIPCNLRKGGRTPRQAGMRLIRKPYRPRWSPLVQRGLNGPIREAWKPFLPEAGADPHPSG